MFAVIRPTLDTGRRRWISSQLPVDIDGMDAVLYGHFYCPERIGAYQFLHLDLQKEQRFNGYDWILKLKSKHFTVK